MTGKLILYTKNPSATVTFTHDSGATFSVTSMNGIATIPLQGVFDLPNGNGATLIVDNMTFRGVLWMNGDIINPVNGSASFAIDTFPFSYPPVPSREQVLGINMHFRGGIVVDSPVFGKMPWWPSALSWVDPATRQLVYSSMRSIGDTHCIIEIPSGAPLYDEPNQFYTADKFPSLDWTNGLTSMSPLLSELVDEVIREGFFYIIAMDEHVDTSTKVVQLVMNILTDEQLSFGFVMPGYDGVFYGWTPAQITNWAKVARVIKPSAYLGIEFNIGHIPLGNGIPDYMPGGAMGGYDVILGEFPSPVTGDAVWQILGRCIRPYNRPPEQVGDPNPPFYLVDSPRGPRYFCAFETSYPYLWVRVDMSNQQAIDTEIATIENERTTFTSLGCKYIG